MYEILSKQKITPNTFRMEIFSPRIAKKAKAGQFIILRVNKDGERVPLTIVDRNLEKGSTDIIFQEVGYSTSLLAKMEVGDALADYLGPLGRPSELEDMERVICIGGGVGTAVVFPSVKALYQNGKYVEAIVGARSKEHIILEEEINQYTHDLHFTTDDGSYGQKGFVTDKLRELLDKGGYDHVIAIGPMIMMKFVCKLTAEYGIKTTVSLNPLMVDGTGMCGCCRVTVGDEVKYACVDGPDFDGHLVNFDEIMARQGTYVEEEADMERRCGGIYHD